MKREEWRPFALLACLYANAHRSEHRAPFEIDDFMPISETYTKPRQQSTEEQIYLLRSWAAMQPGSMHMT